MVSVERYYPGATAVGIRVKEGVILAADKRVTYGYLLMSKAGRKVYKILDRVGIASAGFISDMQTLARTLEAEMKLYEYESGLVPRVYTVSKMLSLILYNRRFFPYFVETIVGGWDDLGSHIYVLDPLGAIIEDNYAALGSGAQLAISIIEDKYSDDMSLEQAEKLAVDAVTAAFKRDAISGDGVDMLVISRDYLREKFMPIAV